MKAGTNVLLKLILLVTRAKEEVIIGQGYTSIEPKTIESNLRVAIYQIG